MLLKRAQRGERLVMPFSRPMPAIGPRCHELRIGDGHLEWRIFYHVGLSAIVVLEVAAKKSQRAPRRVIEGCKRRLALYRSCAREGDTP